MSNPNLEESKLLLLLDRIPEEKKLAWMVQAVDKLIAGDETYMRIWKVLRKLMLEDRDEATLEEMQELEEIAELLEQEESGGLLVKLS